VRRGAPLRQGARTNASGGQVEKDQRLDLITLDGVFDDPGGAEDAEHGGWSNPYFNDEAAKYAREQLWWSDALLLGRKTYEEFAANSPNMEETEGDFAMRMNTLPKFVASSTLEEPLDWNNSSLIKGDVAEAVAKLKDEPGRLIHHSEILSLRGDSYRLRGKGPRRPQRRQTR
jgi:dihydrofolate reductase